MSDKKPKNVKQKEARIGDKMKGLIGFYTPEELKPKTEEKIKE